MVRSVIQYMNALLTQGFDLLFWPFQHTEPIWGLVVISGLSGLLLLWIFGCVSRQSAIRKIRERIRGNILGVSLYQHDMRVALKLQVAIMRDICTYAAYAFWPTLVLMIPAILILAQLNLRFALSPMRPGSAALLKVTLADDADMETPIALDVPSGVATETPGVRVRSKREVAWRIRAERPGRYTLQLHVDGRVMAKQVRVGEAWGAVSAQRARSPVMALLYPGEPLLAPSDQVALIEVQYPRLPLELFGWSVHWLALFLVVSLLTGFACKRMLGVEV